MHAEVHQWDMALDLIERAVKVNDQSPDILNNLGIVLKELGIPLTLKTPKSKVFGGKRA